MRTPIIFAAALCGATLPSTSLAGPILLTGVGVSSFGGLLGRAELDALIGVKSDLAAFVNDGDGLLAMAQCDPCGANLLAGATAPRCSEQWRQKRRPSPNNLYLAPGG